MQTTVQSNNKASTAIAKSTLFITNRINVSVKCITDTLVLTEQQYDMSRNLIKRYGMGNRAQHLTAVAITGITAVATMGNWLVGAGKVTRANIPTQAEFQAMKQRVIDFYTNFETRVKGWNRAN